jgi:hypothetical protein
MNTNLHTDLSHSAFNHTNNGLPTAVTSTITLGQAENVRWLSSRIWHGRTVEDLRAMGIILTGKSQGNYIQTILPMGWSVVQSGVSMYQKLLLDQDGQVRGRLFYQPGSAGGGMEMCIEGSKH